MSDIRINRITRVTRTGGGKFDITSPTFANVVNPSPINVGIPANITFDISDDSAHPQFIIITATSSNQAAIPNSSISHSGTGTSRTVTVTGIAPGITNITIIARDPSGNVQQELVTIQVLA